jgi:hypothetical protein
MEVASMTPWCERPSERGSALVVTVLLLALLLVLGMTLLATATMESTIAANDRWSEGAFYAAEAAVQTAVDALARDPASASDPVPTTQLGDHYTYRSGSRDDAAAEPPQLLGTTSAEGYSLGTGTGYNASGFVFQIYQVNGTGTGPRNAQREVEVQVAVGPVPQ